MRSPETPAEPKLSGGDITTIDAFYAGQVSNTSSDACSADGGRWSLMTGALGCCFDLQNGKPIGTGYNFCGSDEILNHRFSQPLERFHEELATLCRKDNLSYDQLKFRCVAVSVD